jgi:TolB-like protein
MGRLLWSCLVVVALVAPANAQKKQIRLAVMDFTPSSTSAELAPLGVGLQSMLTTDLGIVPAFVIVERARLRDIQSELKLHESNLVDKDTAAKIGGLAGASHLLVGSFTVVNGRMRIDVRLFSVASGAIVLAEKQEGEQAKFFEIEQALVRRIVESVQVKLQKAEKATLQKAQTQSFEAFERYSEGLVLFDEKQTDKAIVAMQAALAADPSFTLASQKLTELQAAIPVVRPPEVKPPPQCQQNPLQTPSCNQNPSDPGFRAPTMVMGDGSKPYDIIVRAQGEQTQCITPCPLYLPKGKVEVDVLSPTKFSRTLDGTGGPATIRVSRLNKTNIIIGSVLTGLTIAMIGATAGLHEATSTAPTSTTASQASQYWPVTLSLATGMAFPAIYYLVQMGKTDARVVTP